MDGAEEAATMVPPSNSGMAAAVFVIDEGVVWLAVPHYFGAIFRHIDSFY